MKQEYYCPNCFTAKKNLETQCMACLYEPEVRNPTYLKPQGRLHQQYLIGRVLGHGGFGITYLAFDAKLKTRVAIKEYFPSTWASRADSTIHPHTGPKGQLFEKCKANFIEEARMLTQFHSPHIIRVLNMFEALGTAYYVMEYLEGETLKTRIERNGPLSFKEAEKVLKPLMSALEEIHSQQVYHRDIKPENIYLTENRGPILLDFGAARYYSANESQSLTAVLTPGYAPVEQYFSTGKQGPWTDIYALAATGYYMLTGHSPPEAPALAEKQESLRLPSVMGANISSTEEQWLLWGLSAKLDQRPQNIEQWKHSSPQAPPLPKQPKPEPASLPQQPTAPAQPQITSPQTPQINHFSYLLIIGSLAGLLIYFAFFRTSQISGQGETTQQAIASSSATHTLPPSAVSSSVPEPESSPTPFASQESALEDTSLETPEQTVADNQADIEAAKAKVIDFLNYWQSKNLEAVEFLIHNDFKSEEGNFTKWAWLDARRKEAEISESRSITIQDMQASISGDRAYVEYLQSYDETYTPEHGGKPYHSFARAKIELIKWSDGQWYLYRLKYTSP